MFSKILIANRGEIAVRVMRTARRLGVRTVAVYSDADAGALHVEMADEAVHIGPAPASDSYLDGAAIIDAALRSGAEAIHPGYGFLSENPDFVEAVEKAGLVFIGPSAKAIRAMGLKDAAKQMMERAKVPVVPGYHGDAQEVVILSGKANEIGFPVLIKARAGGGGKGMRRVDQQSDFPDALSAAKREARSAFGDDRVLVEKYVATPRHIEVQVFGDSHGNVVHLFERDCSLQRRHQKVIEEAPAPGMTAEMREAMGRAAVNAAKAIGYEGAGTIEFIVDASEGLRPDRFWFMEMNTRLQVEHPVTELITGLDLVEWQLRVASGEPLPKRQDELAIDGWAMEARLYAEDPARNFLPATGTIAHLQFPDNGVRVDAGVRAGDAITPYYDPLIAKIIVHAADRAQALSRLRSALDGTELVGTTTNLSFLSALARSADFSEERLDTGLIDRKLSSLTGEREPPRLLSRVAAVLLSGLHGPEGARSGDLFGRLGPWQHWTRTVRRVDLHGQISTVAWVRHGEFEVTPEGEPAAFIKIEHLDDGLLKVTQDGHSTRLRVVWSPTRFALLMGGVSAEFEMPRIAWDGDADGQGGGDGVLRAPMPGLVRQVTVSIGQTVKAGDPMVVLEAMKMEMTLTAARAGTVSEIAVDAAAQVAEGDWLVRLQAEEER